ncbi:MAG: hypothetical protein E6Q88_08975 [Lysobacteraceae bacterium]|nr:MAG: hypothetical protein E6Q88_08975 [Xanthomonadaceae bacterium]
MRPTKRKSPRTGRRRGSDAVAFGQSSNSPKPTGPRRGWQGHRMPRNWRDRMPEPETYYRARVESLGARHANGWAQGRCPFHDDGTASLSVHLDSPRGGWRCFAGCGSGDLLAFHMRQTGMGFVEAVRDLVRGVP